MLVRVCDVCGEKLDADNLIKLDGGLIRSAEMYKNKHEYDFPERDICLKCARTYNLTQIIELVRKPNV